VDAQRTVLLFHVHAYGDEWFYMSSIEGELSMTVGDESFTGRGWHSSGCVAQFTAL